MPRLSASTLAAALAASALATTAAHAAKPSPSRGKRPEVQSVPETRPEPAPPPAAPVRPAEVREPSTPAREGFTLDRVGVGLDLFAESSRMGGEQWINNYRTDESFDYSAGPLAANVYVLANMTERIKAGPGLRFLGNYGTNRFTFGYLGELYAQAELSLRAFEEVDAVFGARGGLALLVPGEQFADEIRRLQAQQADVWSVPRVGWTAGASVGARRKISAKLFARLDITGSLGHQFLFATDQIVDGLRFRKYWGNDTRRLGVTLGFEIAL